MITAGRIVHYTLTKEDAEKINRRRTSGASIAARMNTSCILDNGIPIKAWPEGAQAHIGNTANEGDVVPMLVVRTWSDVTVNGQAFLDGNDVLWVTSATEGTGPRTWHFPPKV